MIEEDDCYLKYRGKCKEMSEALVAQYPGLLMLVRGHYIDPDWGEQAHWWCTKLDGTIVDPTALQFPSQGHGQYIPFNGMVTCETCGKELEEGKATIDGHHTFCSYRCHGICVGLI